MKLVASKVIQQPNVAEYERLLEIFWPLISHKIVEFIAKSKSKDIMYF